MLSEEEKARVQVGYRQTVRALSEKKAAKVFLALDCDEEIKNSVSELSRDSGAELVTVTTMKELGAQCGINVKASCAVVLS